MSIHLALRVAIESNIFITIDSAKPSMQLSTLEIASRLPIKDPRSIVILDQLLRFLSVKFLLKSSLRPVGLTPTQWDEDPKETSVAPLVIFGAENVLFERMSMLKDAILDPENSPFFTSKRADLFDVSSKNPILNKSFNEVMAFWSRIVIRKVLAKYKGLEEVKELLDVGGGMGIILHNIVRAYPHIRGINFDLPHVIAEAPVQEGVEHMAGDMFDSLPKAETIWMKAILHDWDDETCNKILRNCYNALREEGKLLVVEILAPENSNNDEDLSENAMVSEFYVMLLNLHGKERTAEQYDELARAGGFAETKFFHIWDGLHVMEFLKKKTSN
ncbi:hypothetical protein SAY87_009570 [Trapa incisa]|uniref:O-methyltransferase C-terminal domain-containing protein n=1 Tax=Trapa incisa TaxID=236973 RepID=A0AAN7K1X3_9MYRT|nr:hypothetical protein SAY87_009570 [Trapa incisa]